MMKFYIERALHITDEGRRPVIRHHDGIGSRIETARCNGEILGRYLTELNGHFVLRMNDGTCQNKAAYNEAGVVLNGHRSYRWFR
jgi:hypothetical protein